MFVNVSSYISTLDYLCDYTSVGQKEGESVVEQKVGQVALS